MVVTAQIIHSVKGSSLAGTVNPAVHQRSTYRIANDLGARKKSTRRNPVPQRMMGSSAPELKGRLRES